MIRKQPSRMEIEQLKITLLDIAFDHATKQTKKRAEELHYQLLLPGQDYKVYEAVDRFITEVYGKNQ